VRNLKLNLIRIIALSLEKKELLSPTTFMTGDEWTSVEEGPITVLKDAFGSHRFLYFYRGEIIAALHVMVFDNKPSIIHSAVDPRFHGNDLLMKLFEFAREQFPNLEESYYLKEKDRIQVERPSDVRQFPYETVRPNHSF